MSYFKTYVSNTFAGSANQHVFSMNEGEVRTSRVFYKITEGGEYKYSLLYSSIIDGSFRRIGTPNTICDEWKIHKARVGKCCNFPDEKAVEDVDLDRDCEIKWLAKLTFDSKKSYTPDGGELFCTDPVPLSFEKGEYICVELTFSGAILPHHPEIQVPVYIFKDEKWVYGVETPVPCMIGCNRRIKERVAYLGDSITQGCGAGINSYKHWNATLSELLGGERAYWNLGIGYGKVSDPASDGAHMFKALQNDTVFVCYGVNDINSGKDADTVIKELHFVVDKLKENGCRVILQTTPPFDYPEERRIVWEEVNRRIKGEFADKAERIFDCVPILGEKDAPHMAKYGGHPNADGCTLWANALYEEIKNLF